MNALISRVLPRAMVLIYHRVVDLDSDPQRLCVTPENFARHMDIISRNYQPISLVELTDDLSKGSVRDRAVVVTFDDGYEDNYQFARPILEKYGIAATIFVASGYTGAEREFWWDELDRLILGKQGLPEELCLMLGGEECHWMVSDSGDARDTQSGRLAPHDIYMDLCSRFKGLGAEQIDMAIEQLRMVTGNNGEARLDYRPMNNEQLCSLHKGGLIEIGAHTRSHVNLAAQTAEKQKEEIEGSKKDLERILGEDVLSFSYPFGTFDNYTDQSLRCVKNAGFRNAIANFSGNVTRFSSVYEMPRRMVRDWDGETFLGVLDSYYSG